MCPSVCHGRELHHALELVEELYRHRQRLGVELLRYSVLSNQDLDRVVTNILQNASNASEAYILGSLRSCGLMIQRWKIWKIVKTLSNCHNSILPYQVTSESSKMCVFVCGVRAHARAHTHTPTHTGQLCVNCIV